MSCPLLPSAMTETPGTPYIEQLLAQKDIRQQLKLLRGAALLNANGLEQLLDAASQLVRSDPAQGRRLAALCVNILRHTPIADSQALIPRAAYIQAQAYAINAEYDAALALIDSAYNNYQKLGMLQDALRTSIGRMHVLKEQGRYHEALQCGQSIVASLQAASDSEDTQLLIHSMAYQNMGVCLEELGRYDEALQAYTAAEHGYQVLEMPERLGEILNNRGIVLLGLGRSSEALSAFEHAATIFAQAELTVPHADSLLNAGNAQLLLGQYTRALALFEQARQLLTTLDAVADKAVLTLDTGAAYLALNLLPEALSSYREAVQQLKIADMPHDTARALWGLGSALLAEGHLAEAARVLEEANQLFEQTGNLPMRAGVLLEQAALKNNQDKPAEAYQLAKHALELVSNQDLPVQQIFAHLRLADIHIDPAQTEQHLQQAELLAAEVAMPFIRYRLEQRRGRLCLDQQHFEQAEQHLHSALSELEQLRGTLAHESLRVSFLRDKAAAYEDLIRLYLLRKNDEAAFEIAERAKSRALLDLLRGARTQQLSADTQSDDQLRTLSAELHAVYDELLGGSTAFSRSMNITELRTRAFELEQEIGRLHLQAAASTASPEALTAPLPFEHLSHLLAPDSTLLSYHLCDDSIVAFVYSNGELMATQPFGSRTQLQSLLQRLEVQWDRLRAGTGMVAQHLPMLEQSARRVLAELYQAIVAPLRHMLPETGRLALVPHGLLHRVPFQALFDGQQYLIDQYEISYAPSATILALCQQRPTQEQGIALVLGVRDDSIPAVTEEVESITQLLPHSHSFLDEQATLERLRSQSQHCRIVHLACHGLFRDDNPAFSALKLGDGWLSAGDVLNLDFDGALVMLSACESQRGQDRSGDEIVGLTRAFLGAGASTLIASLWLAQDNSTALLATTFYRHLSASNSPTAALRQAQLSVRQSHPHPYFWAPFVVVGKG